MLELAQVAERRPRLRDLAHAPSRGPHPVCPARPILVPATPRPAAHWGRSHPHTGAPPRRAGRARRPDLLQPPVSAPWRRASDTGSAATQRARPAPGSSAGAAWRPQARCARGRARLMPTYMSAVPLSAGPAVFGRDLQCLLVGAHRLAETTLRNPDVRQSDRTTEHVGDVPSPLQTRHAIGIRPVRCLEIPACPGRESQKARRPLHARDDRPHRPVRAPAGHGSRWRPHRRASWPARHGRWRSHPEDLRNSSSSTTTIPADGAWGPSPMSSVWPATARRPADATQRPRARR